MADTEQDTKEPWDGYDDASADELIDAAGRKRSAELLVAAVAYEKANKDRVTVVEAFEARVDALNADADAGDRQGEAEPAAEPELAPDVTDEQDTSGRKTSGQIAAQQAADREQQRPEINAKADKAAAEGGVTPTPSPGPVYAKENRQDRVELAGHEYRVDDDVEPDPAYRFDLEAALQAPLVNHIAVAAGTEGMYLEIDGRYHRLDVQSSVALARLTQAASVPLNN